MATEEFEISCFIPGAKNTFTVDVEKSRGVTLLKDKLKEKKPQTFADVEADHLQLYQVIINDDLDKKPRMEELERLYKEKEKEGKQLDERRMLSKYFGESPPEGFKFYVIIEIPRGESIFYCGMPGDLSHYLLMLTCILL